MVVVVFVFMGFCEVVGGGWNVVESGVVRLGFGGGRCFFLGYYRFLRELFFRLSFF